MKSESFGLKASFAKKAAKFADEKLLKVSDIFLFFCKIKKFFFSDIGRNWIEPDDASNAKKIQHPF